MDKHKRRKLTLFLIVMVISCTNGIVACKTKTQKPEIHRSTSAISIKARYMGWACGDLTPQAMPIDDISGISKEKLEYGFTFYTAHGLKSPDNIDEICVSNNAFMIRGYYYYTIEKDKKYLHQRFDLISWHPVAPFNVWGTNAKIIESGDYKRFEYKTKEPVNDSEFTKARKYDPC